jgi:hypothetical protein
MWIEDRGQVKAAKVSNTCLNCAPDALLIFWFFLPLAIYLS